MQQLPACLEFYCEILTGIEPLEHLHLVVRDDATAEFLGTVSTRRRDCRGLEEIRRAVEEHRNALRSGVLIPHLKRFEPEAGNEPALVELSMQAIVEPPDERPARYDVGALYLIKGKKLYHLSEFWSQRLDAPLH